MSGERSNEVELRRAADDAQARLERVRVAVGDLLAIRAAEELALETRAALRDYQQAQAEAVAKSRLALDDAKP